MPRVSVVVPIFNSIAHIPAFFEALACALPPGSQVIVVDDASTQPVLDAVPELPQAESLVRLRNATNLGYAGAVNRGFQVVTGEIVIQLDVDAIVEKNCISAMIDIIGRHSKDVGIVGSKLVYPTTGRTQSVGMAFGFHSKRHVFRHLPKDHPLCLRTREVQITTGATVAMTRRVLDQLGPLDERLYNHNLDLDHCLRAVHVGLRNFMCAESIAYHWRNQSGGVRYARVEAAEAAFWGKWSGKYRVDLGRFMDEALDHVFSVSPDLERTPFTLLDLSRDADQPIALERLAARWPGISNDVRYFRQMNNTSPRLWLPIVLPHGLVDEPVPFLYLVDDHQELEENAMWFDRRRRVVRQELVVDLSATVKPTCQISERSGAPQSDPQ